MSPNFKSKFLMLAILISCVYCFHLTVANANPDELFRGGQIDYSFTPPQIYLPIDDNVRTVAIQRDGKILAVGTFMPSARYKLFRFLPDGQIDTSFNPNFNPSTSVESFALQSDGKILYTALTEGISTITRLNPDGSRDASFNHRSSGYIPKLIALPDGKVLVLNTTSIKRLNPNGDIDTSFNFTSLLGMQLRDLIVQPDGKFIINFARLIGSAYAWEIFRCNSDGSRDTTFQMNPIVFGINHIALQSNGKILANTSLSSIKRFNLDGSEDSTFSAQNTLQVIGSMALQDDGKILLGGSSSGNPRMERLFADGGRDTSFMSSFASGVIYTGRDGAIFLRGPNTIGGKIVGIVKLKGDFTPTRQKAFDFDGDSKSDISVFRPSTGVWYWLNSSNGTFSGIQFGISEDKPVPADYDGDEKTDIAVYRPSTGIWHFLYSSSGQYSAYQFGISSDIPTPNDFDGDGKDDISVFRPSTAVWYRVNSSNNQVTIQQFGNAEDRPVQGDYDGDGKSDLAVWKPHPTESGIWSYFSSLTNSVKTFQHGYESDNITPADYDGDGKTDFTIWRSANGGWYGTRSFNGTGFFTIWGIAGDIPVPTDYDGDGKDDIAIYRPSTGTWLISRTSDGTLAAYGFGLNGDIPLPATLVR